MNKRALKVGDTVKITSDISKLKAMRAGWVGELSDWAGRLAVVSRIPLHCNDRVRLIPTPLDRVLGIFSPTEPGWMFDFDVLEVVEEAEEASLGVTEQSSTLGNLA